MEVYAYSKNGNVVGTVQVETVKGQGWGNGYVKYTNFNPKR